MLSSNTEWFPPQSLLSTSNHWIPNKHAGFHSKINGILKAPTSPSAYKTELNTVKHITKGNVYYPCLIEILEKSRIKNFYTVTTT
jgi:hypothetical protein